jgi:YD repeat-containing protein
MPVPEPHVLTAAEVPATPQPALTCGIAPETPAVRHLGPCSAVGFLTRDQSDPYLTRATNLWSSGQLVDATQEIWGNYPSARRTDYLRTSQHQIHDANGRLFEAVGARDYFQSPEIMYSESTRTVVDYAYDAAGKLASSTTRGRSRNPDSTPETYPENSWEGSTFFVDARGTVFTKTKFPLAGGPFWLQDGDFTVYPDGMVRTATITSVQNGGGYLRTVDTTSYDESGLVLEHDTTAFNRFGYPSITTVTYNYSAGLIANVFTVTAYEKPSTAVYKYDAAGNNFERVTTNADGSLKSTWTGVYDRGGNLVCESTTNANGELLNIVHYDYGCF